MKNLYFTFILTSFSGILLAFDGGTGTLEDPYRIATAEDLVSIGSDENLLDKHYILTADIDLSAYIFTEAVIAPDANNVNYEYDGIPFTGCFDGNDHKIINLTVDSRADEDTSNNENDYFGLFGCLSSPCEVKDLIIENALIVAWARSYYVSILAGANGKYMDVDGGTIHNCRVSGSIQGVGYAGGLVGHNKDGTVSSCRSDCNITVLNYGEIGGLVGVNKGTIIDSFSTGSITAGANNPSEIGGLAGASLDSGVVSKCFSLVSIRAGYSARVGGLIGNCVGSTVSDCYASGAVYGGDYVGGLIGNNSEGSIFRCYSNGKVHGNHSGGLLGQDTDGSVTNSFWNMESSDKISSAGGTGKMHDEFAQNSIYVDAGWDFSDEDGDPAVWREVEGSAPVLAWQNLVEVPDVTGMNENAAQETMNMLGLRTGDVAVYYNETVEKDCVISQSIESGQYLPEGSTVDLVVSDGTAPREYRIETPQDLFALANDSDNYDKHYILMNDIDMSGYVFDKAVIAPGIINMWNYEGVPFTGIFEGNGHKISNITIDALFGSVLGLFGKIDSEGVVRDLGVENIMINITVSTCYYAGGIAGLNYGTVKNCHVTGTFTFENGGWDVGGLVGASNSYVPIEDCFTDVDIYATDDSYCTGGIAGQGNDFIRCYSKGNIEGGEYTGGIAGYSSVLKDW